MLVLIILSLGISRSFSSPIISVLKSASELEYEDSIIIQPIRNEDMQPQLCVLSFPFNTTTGGKIFKLLLTVWSLWGNPGMARCREMSILSAGYIPHRKVTSASSSGSLGFIVCVKCCRMVDSVPRWLLSLSWPTQSDHLSITDRMIPPSGREHSHGKTSTFLESRSW